MDRRDCLVTELQQHALFPASHLFEGTPFDFADRRLQQGLRCLYKLPRMSIPDWKVRIPNGFTVARIDDELLDRPDLVNVGRLLDEIRSMWNDETDFLSHGFGFCALEGDTVVSWCTAEYVSEGRCGIGIETVEEYQGLGLATLTASAFVGHCLQHDISPHWDTWCSNLPSVRVAEKVGFRTAAEYNVYVT